MNRHPRQRPGGLLLTAWVLAGALLLPACDGQRALPQAGAEEDAAGSAGALEALALSSQTPSRPTLDMARIGYDQGSADAPIKVIEVSDFGCGYCRIFNQETFPAIEKEFIETGLVQWKFVPYVLGIFPNGDKAALAAECAGEQGLESFLSLRGRLFAQQGGWQNTEDPQAFFTRLANEEGLRVDRFERCLREEGRKDQVELDRRLGAALGARGTPTFIVSGLPVSGAISLEDFRGFVEFFLKEGGSPSRDWLPPPPIPGALAPEAELLASGLGHSIGSPDAPVHLIEFSDFGCGYCRLFQEQTRPALVQEYVESGRVRWTYVPFVLGIFPNGDAAALASECAGEQGHFERLRLRLYRDQQGWKDEQNPRAFFSQLAREEGLDPRRFAECLDGEAAPARVQESTLVGQRGGIRGTPTFFVNGFRVSGNFPLDAFRDLLDLELSSLPRGAGR